MATLLARARGAGKVGQVYNQKYSEDASHGDELGRALKDKPLAA